MVRGSPSLAVLGVARVEAEEGMWAGVWGRWVVVTTEGGVERERFMNGHGSCQGSIFRDGGAERTFRDECVWFVTVSWGGGRKPI